MGLQLLQEGRAGGAELGLVAGLLQELGQALPQPLPPEIWVPTGKRLVSTFSPSPLWLFASQCLPPVLHCSFTPQQCCRSTRSSSARGVWLMPGAPMAQVEKGMLETKSPELWGHSCCQGQQSTWSIPHGTEHQQNTRLTPTPGSPPLAHRAMNGQRGLPKHKSQVLPEPSPLPSTGMLWQMLQRQHESS